MRRTTELIMAHLPISLALLIETFLGAPSKEAGKCDHFDIVVGGHEELIQENDISQFVPVQMFYGAAAGGNISLLKKAINVSETIGSHRLINLKIYPRIPDCIDIALTHALIYGADNAVFDVLGICYKNIFWGDS